MSANPGNCPLQQDKGGPHRVSMLHRPELGAQQPKPCLGLGGAEVVRAPKLRHAVERVNRRGARISSTEWRLAHRLAYLHHVLFLGRRADWLSRLFEADPTSGEVDFGGLRAILDVCRLDLDGLTKDMTGNGPVDHVARTGQGELEARLCRMIERLQHVAGTLDEVLAREADHRIKNRLQTVVALLEQQAKRAEADTVREALCLAGARMEAVAQVRATPGSNGTISKLDLGSYLRGLCIALGQAMDVEGKRRSLYVEVEPLEVSLTTAQQFGLIVTELVTNALRHAFLPNQPGIVQVTGMRQRDGSYKPCVADDGKGLPRGFDSRLRLSGLGLRLVNVVADQLRARLTMDKHAGARFTLTFSVPADSIST